MPPHPVGGVMYRRFIRVLCVAVYVVSFFVGCSAIRQSYDALEACRHDAVCYAQMKQGAELPAAVATAASASIPSVAPFSPVIGSTVGMLASLLIGVYLGKKKGR